ncbi:MAG: hypothetical protein LBU32_28175 [Clostridiales bacterium]|jgi:hypothetical protein|nr:hypothetical protein [Clostridiales bacterium]
MKFLDGSDSIEKPWLYTHSPEFERNMQLLLKRNITLTDWHVHIFRGGMTPEKAEERGRESGILSGVVENQGVEWPLCDDAALKEYIKNVHKAVGHELPLGIQVNDRDWYKRTSPDLLAQLDYVLADTMIMGRTLDGSKQQRLWLIKSDMYTPDEADAWFEHYLLHCLCVVREPISILANPTYLPEFVASYYERLWTAERMNELIYAAIHNDIRLEIQAGSLYPKLEFIKLAKLAGAKFTVGSNNFFDRALDTTAWFRAIEEADLSAEDFAAPTKKFP